MQSDEKLSHEPRRPIRTDQLASLVGPAAGLRRGEEICKLDPNFSAKIAKFNSGRNKNLEFTAIQI